MTLILHKLLNGRTTIDLILWGLVFVFILVGIGWALRLEKRRFLSIGKQSSWFWLRLFSVPILVLTGLVVWLPARAISGPVALGYFYLALFTLAPICWFGLHRIIGSIVSPRLTKAESTGIALTGLAILIVPALLVSMLQGSVFMASHRWQERGFARAHQVPLAHRVLPMQRFRLGKQGEIYTQTLDAPAGVRLERIEAFLGGHRHDTKTTMHSYFCRQDDDIHLAWSADSSPPPLRLYWYDSNKKLVQAEFRVDNQAAQQLPVGDFAVGWRDEGVDLPAPVSRDNVQLGWIGTANTLSYRSLNSLQPGETFENDCVMEGYQRVAWRDEGPIAALILRFNPNYPGKPWQYEVKRPE